MEFILAVFVLCFLGAIAGFLAGLLGIGGGVVLVPGIYYLLNQFGYHEHAMHIAVGTSLFTIIFTGTSSAYAHHKKGAVNLGLLKNFLPGVFFGVVIGTSLAQISSTFILKIIFASSQIIFGSYMIIRSQKTSFFQTMPDQPWFSIIAAANACLSTLMGVGGGVQNVVFMTICNVPIHQAVATAAAIGPLIALIGAVGFAIIGWTNNVLPFSVGYVNLIMSGFIILTSMLTAPLGVELAHRLPVAKLKRCFGVFMMMVSIHMVFGSILHS